MHVLYVCMLCCMYECMYVTSLAARSSSLVAESSGAVYDLAQLGIAHRPLFARHEAGVPTELQCGHHGAW